MYFVGAFGNEFHGAARCSPIPTTARRRPSSASRRTRPTTTSTCASRSATLGDAQRRPAVLGEPAHAHGRHAHLGARSSARPRAAAIRRTSASRTATGTSTGSARTSTTRRSTSCRRVAGRRHHRHPVQVEQHDRRTRSCSACSRTRASSRRSTSRSASRLDRRDVPRDLRHRGRCAAAARCAHDAPTSDELPMQPAARRCAPSN